MDIGRISGLFSGPRGCHWSTLQRCRGRSELAVELHEPEEELGRTAGVEPAALLPGIPPPSSSGPASCCLPPSSATSEN